MPAPLDLLLSRSIDAPDVAEGAPAPPPPPTQLRGIVTPAGTESSLCTVQMPLTVLDKSGLVQPTPFLLGLNDVSWSFREVFPKMGEALGMLCKDLAETRGELCGVIMFDNFATYHDVGEADSERSILQQFRRGGTDFGKALCALYDQMERRKDDGRPFHVFFITDGAHNNDYSTQYNFQWTPALQKVHDLMATVPGSRMEAWYVGRSRDVPENMQLIPWPRDQRAEVIQNSEVVRRVQTLTHTLFHQHRLRCTATIRSREGGGEERVTIELTAITREDTDKVEFTGLLPRRDTDISSIRMHDAMFVQRGLDGTWTTTPPSHPIEINLEVTRDVVSPLRLMMHEDFMRRADAATLEQLRYDLAHVQDARCQQLDVYLGEMLGATGNGDPSRYLERIARCASILWYNRDATGRDKRKLGQAMRKLARTLTRSQEEVRAESQADAQRFHAFLSTAACAAVGGYEDAVLQDAISGPGPAVFYFSSAGTQGMAEEEDEVIPDPTSLSQEVVLMLNNGAYGMLHPSQTNPVVALATTRQLQDHDVSLRRGCEMGLPMLPSLALVQCDDADFVHRLTGRVATQAILGFPMHLKGQSHVADLLVATLFSSMARLPAQEDAQKLATFALFPYAAGYLAHSPATPVAAFTRVVARLAPRVLRVSTHASFPTTSQTTVGRVTKAWLIVPCSAPPCTISTLHILGTNVKVLAQIEQGLVVTSMGTQTLPARGCLVQGGEGGLWTLEWTEAPSPCLMSDADLPADLPEHLVVHTALRTRVYAEEATAPPLRVSQLDLYDRMVRCCSRPLQEAQECMEDGSHKLAETPGLHFTKAWLALVLARRAGTMDAATAQRAFQQSAEILIFGNLRAALPVDSGSWSRHTLAKLHELPAWKERTPSAEEAEGWEPNVERLVVCMHDSAAFDAALAEETTAAPPPLAVEAARAILEEEAARLLRDTRSGARYRQPFCWSREDLTRALRVCALLLDVRIWEDADAHGGLPHPRMLEALRALACQRTSSEEDLAWILDSVRECPVELDEAMAHDLFPEQWGAFLLPLLQTQGGQPQQLLALPQTPEWLHAPHLSAEIMATFPAPLAFSKLSRVRREQTLARLGKDSRIFQDADKLAKWVQLVPPATIDEAKTLLRTVPRERTLQLSVIQKLSSHILDKLRNFLRDECEIIFTQMAWEAFFGNPQTTRPVLGSRHGAKRRHKLLESCVAYALPVHAEAPAKTTVLLREEDVLRGLKRTFAMENPELLATRLQNAADVKNDLHKSSGACLLLHRTQHLKWMIVALWDSATKTFLDVASSYSSDMEERARLLWNGPKSPSQSIKTWLTRNLSPRELLDLPEEATASHATSFSHEQYTNLLMTQVLPTHDHLRDEATKLLAETSPTEIAKTMTRQRSGRKALDEVPASVLAQLTRAQIEHPTSPNHHTLLRYVIEYQKPPEGAGAMARAWGEL